MCVWLFLNLLAGNPTTVLLKQPAGICYTERRTVHLSICHQVLNKRIATEIHARNILYICRESETQALLKEWFSCRDLIRFGHEGISEVQLWWWVIRSGSQSTFQLIPKVLDWFEVRALCRTVQRSVHTKLGHLFLYGPGVVCGGFVIFKQERNVHKQCWTGWTTCH